MADEIKVYHRLSVINGTINHQFATDQLSLTQSAKGIYDAVHDIGTSEESISAFADISSEGICVIYNIDATNYVQVGFSTTVYGMRLKGAHAPATFNCEPGVTLYLRANTAACKVRLIVYEV